MKAKRVRLNADLAPDVAEALQHLARSQGISLSEAVRRAISTECFLQVQRDEGHKVLLAENGKLRELIFVP